MDDLLADFVAETREMLEASEGEIIAWEANPSDRARLDTIFRFVHTVKGNCGFFDFPRLANLSHAAEDALADCRSGQRTADAALVSAVLAVIDRIVQMVDAIEAGEEFPAGGDEELIAALDPIEETIDGTQNGSPLSMPSSEDSASISTDAVGQDDTLAEINTEPARKPETTPQVQRSIRLPVDLLDRVMSGVSDMVLARNDLAHRLRQAGTQPTIDGPFERLTSILSDVRDAITRMRMQRIETLFSSLPRMVRDLAGELGKQVMVDLEGGDVELDREMIETIRDPLTHIIRNAIDHGIESPSARMANGKREIGLLSISARQSGNTISIVVSDDGEGLAEEKIADKALETGLIDSRQRESMTREKILQLIFEPGFSTADAVSSVSGRGVGLDVVRDNLERVGGSIKVSSTSGVGTLFTLQVPLTLSIITGLTVETDKQRFAIPQSYIEEVLHASSKALDYTKVGDTALITFRGQRIPCLVLSEVLELPTSDSGIETRNLVVLRLASGDQFALVVDGIAHHGDLVIKPLAPAIMKCGLYAGTTLLDDGQPILLLDVTNIASRYDLVSDARTRVRQTDLFEKEDFDQVINRVMLFTDWNDRRCAIHLELVHRIETAPVSVIERSA
ncbi:MAG: chemotaxis protein CheA, partial [Pseudomonadota bacterium]